jgi:hypothetical protein
MTLERAVTDYQAKTPRSRQLFEEALRVMPGGNSRTTACPTLPVHRPRRGRASGMRMGPSGSTSTATTRA